MKTQKEYMDCLKMGFNINIVWKRNIINAYSYHDNRARDCIAGFVSFAKSKGLKFSNCYHAHGIGNNNEYKIFVEERDADGFVIQKNIAELYYCYGIYGGCYVYLKDLATNEKITIGNAR